MINIENFVIDKVKQGLSNYTPSIFITSTYTDTPPSFPCVSVIQQDNSVNTQYIDSDDIENVVDVMFEINVYSNVITGTKQQCNEIIVLVDKIMKDLGFTRSMLRPIPNIDVRIYRITGRYVANVDKENKIYRR